MARGGVADFIDRLNRGVHRGVESDRVIGPGDVVVDRSRNAHGRVAKLVLQRLRAMVGSVAADNHQGVDAMRQQIGVGFLAAFGRTEFLTARTAQDGPAQVDDPPAVLTVASLICLRSDPGSPRR